MSEPQVLRVFTEWDRNEMSWITRRLDVLKRVKEKDLTNDHIAEAEYLVYVSKYFKNKATETFANLSEKRSIQ